MTKKLLSALVLALLCCLSAVAQNLKVESFRALPKDMTARIDAPLKDQNGDWCAVIKVTSNVLNDLEFQAPALGIMKIDKHTGETWVYVPAGSKSINLFHNYCGTLRDYRYPVKIEKQCVYEMKVTGNTEGMNTNLSFSNIVIKVDGNAEIFVNGTSRGYGSWAGTLTSGDYEVECRLEECTPTKRSIRVTAGKDEVINMERPVPFSGQLHVTSSPSSAKIILDGKDANVVTPYTFENVTIGSHKISLSKGDVQTNTREVTIIKDETTNFDFSFGSEVTINSKPSDATLKINGKEVHTPYTTYLTPGNYTVTLEKPKYKTVTKQLHVGDATLTQSFNLPYKFFQPNSVYADLEGQICSNQSGALFLGGAIGGYFKNINAELYYQGALGEAGNTEVEWTNGTETSLVKYMPKAQMGARLGYGFPIGTRFRVTPRLGIGALNVKADNGDKCYAVTGSVDARLDIAIVKYLAFTIVPEYSFAMSQSETFKLISEENSDIKGWPNGFNLRFGLSFNFNL